MSATTFIEDARNNYRAINSPVHCKCLNQDIYFNSDGFNHLINNGLGSRRTIAEIKHKTRLIPLIVPVIKNANEASYERRTVKKNRKKNAPLVVAEYWGISAQVGKTQISVRVIIKRVGNGHLFFWSAMIDKKTKSTTFLE